MLLRGTTGQIASESGIELSDTNIFQRHRRDPSLLVLSDRGRARCVLQQLVRHSHERFRYLDWSGVGDDTVDDSSLQEQHRCPKGG